MPIISSNVATLAAGTTVTWEVTFRPGVTFLPVTVPIAKPAVPSPGMAGVFLGVSNMRTSVAAQGAQAEYAVLFDITNQASIGGPIPYYAVVGTAQ